MTRVPVYWTCAKTGLTKWTRGIILDAIQGESLNHRDKWKPKKSLPYFERFVSLTTYFFEVLVTDARRSKFGSFLCQLARKKSENANGATGGEIASSALRDFFRQLFQQKSNPEVKNNANMPGEF